MCLLVVFRAAKQQLETKKRKRQAKIDKNKGVPWAGIF
jgi:hypothetical protein